VNTASSVPTVQATFLTWRRENAAYCLPVIPAVEPIDRNSRNLMQTLICQRPDEQVALLLLFDCKWIVNPVAAVIQYGTTNNILKQIHTTTSDTQDNATVGLIY
jgi:hypothetical protein